MTNEEAIAYFKRHIDLYCVTGICREAEEMAIQALEQEPICPSAGIDCEDCPAYEPSGDLIQRQAVLDMIEGFIADATSHGISARLDPYYVMDGIKNLPSVKPQLCEDVISRREAIKKFTYNYKGQRIPDYDYDNWPVQIDIKTVKEMLRELPSVKPQERTGHWKRISIDKYSEHSTYWYRCDRCGKDNLGNTDFCPNCGARMSENPTGSDVIWYHNRNYSEIVVEPQESEE